ncbi:hypothetical protein NT2_13_00190 [Caenibius tardaugens NBRC 16725]|uniref:Uncharacterized protein n=1 Tax=Caenibius tardaugens NBRC 16725 TaxID=1219035 RepID=U3A849_9SPHN|nr:hypothetical protein [Caenibius tardaugens]AZI37932.1 hypothetical protein EGO55_19810 [Caenibius tardaugens NBRC 16725]GAD50933.1 hypothetical protein NT2_13_00190 [Caenibius tardaugens NBRC 16725]
MTGQRCFATFSAEVPDDWEFSEAGEILIPGGRGVCLLIMRHLQNLGLDVSEPKQHQFYGWELKGEWDGSQFWFLLQYPDPWLLISEDKTGIIGFLKPERPSLTHLLRRFNIEMSDDDHFHNIQWFAKK